MYNQRVDTPGRAGYAWELLRRRTLRQLTRHGGWLAFGFGGAVVITCYFILQPFHFYSGTQEVRRLAMWLAAWLLAYTELYLLSAWLAPHASADEEDIEHLPLPAGQFVLQRMLDRASVPLVNLVLCLPLFWVGLIYSGQPYGEGQAPSSAWSWIEPASGPYVDSNPWAIRLLLIGVNLCCAVLLPLALGFALELLAPWVALRVVLLPGLPLALYFLSREWQVNYDLFRIAYYQTRGYAAWTFITVFACFAIIPYLLARSDPGKRRAGGLGLMLLALAAAILIFAQGQLPGQHTTATIRSALGDLRFAMAYFTCHLSPAMNIDMLMYSYPSNVLFNDAYAHNLIPQRVALWVGAGLYPPLLCLLALGGMWLGASRRGRRGFVE